MSIITYIYNKLFLYQLVVTLAAQFALQTILYLQARHRRHQLFSFYGIPGPKPDILEGNYAIFRERPFRFDIDKRLRDQYGKIFGLFFGDVPRLMISDLQILKKVFIEDTHIFKDRAETYFSATITDNSILFARHHLWKGLRRMMSPFFSSRAIKDGESVALVDDTINSLINYIDNRLEPRESAKSMAIIDVLDLMKSTTLYMISSISIKLPSTQI